jgi:hypothetical protein
LYLRDHVLGQMELADASDDPHSARPGAPSSWPAPALPAPKWPPKDSSSPAPRCAVTRGSTPASFAGYWSTAPRPSCPS